MIFDRKKVGNKVGLLCNSFNDRKHTLKVRIICALFKIIVGGISSFYFDRCIHFCIISVQKSKYDTNEFLKVI